MLHQYIVLLGQLIMYTRPRCFGGESEHHHCVSLLVHTRTHTPKRDGRQPGGIIAPAHPLLLTRRRRSAVATLSLGQQPSSALVSCGLLHTRGPHCRVDDDDLRHLERISRWLAI
jgi:hypothetical protein